MTKEKDKDSENRKVKDEDQVNKYQEETDRETNTIPPSPKPAMKIKSVATRRHWSQDDETTIKENGSSIIYGSIKDTRVIYLRQLRTGALYEGLQGGREKTGSLRR